MRPDLGRSHLDRILGEVITAVHHRRQRAEAHGRGGNLAMRDHVVDQRRIQPLPDRRGVHRGGIAGRGTGTRDQGAGLWCIPDAIAARCRRGLGLAGTAPAWQSSRPCHRTAAPGYEPAAATPRRRRLRWPCPLHHATTWPFPRAAVVPPATSVLPGSATAFDREPDAHPGGNVIFRARAPSQGFAAHARADQRIPAPAGAHGRILEGAPYDQLRLFR